MPILVTCSCGKSIRAKDELRGKKVRCPGCNEPLLIADAASEPERPSRASRPKGPPPLVRKETAPDETGPEETTGPGVWTRKKGGVVAVVVVAENEVCAGSFPKEDWRDHRGDVEEGTNLEEIFASHTRIPFESIKQVRMDLKRTGILVDRSAEEDKDETVTIAVTDDSEREEIFAALRRGLGRDWRRTEKVVSPLGAALYPGVISLLVIAGTIVVYLAAKQVHTEEVNVTGRNAGLKRFAAWLMETLGPTGMMLIGLAVLAGCIVWAVVSMLKPPHWIMLEPRGDKEE